MSTRAEAEAVGAALDAYPNADSTFGEGWSWRIDEPEAGPVSVELVSPAPVDDIVIRVRGEHSFEVVFCPEKMTFLDLLESDMSEAEIDLWAANEKGRVEEIRAFLNNSPNLSNYLVNKLEYFRGDTRLTSYPTDISIPIADVCNARCTFCTSWLEGKRFIKLSEIDAYEDLFRNARAFALAGHGEPLSHPELGDILLRLQDWLDPHARGYVITNGIYLEKYAEELIRSQVSSYAVSLNAATPETHDVVMGLGEGAFKNVVASIGGLMNRRSSGEINISISISLVVTRQNMHEVADFVELGNRLGVQLIQLKTLAGVEGITPGLNYHTLPPYLHPDFEVHHARAIEVISQSLVPVMADPDSWAVEVFPDEIARQFAEEPPEIISRRDAMTSPEVRKHYQQADRYTRKTRGQRTKNIDDQQGDNPFGRTPRYPCKAPYNNLYINDFSHTMVPCCYMFKVPGHKIVNYDGSYDFLKAWNSPAMIHLRERLKDGPLFNMCQRCPGVY